MSVTPPCIKNAGKSISTTTNERAKESGYYDLNAVHHIPWLHGCGLPAGKHRLHLETTTGQNIHIKGTLAATSGVFNIVHCVIPARLLLQLKFSHRTMNEQKLNPSTQSDKTTTIDPTHAHLNM
jgi:hypothetical protein